ncbi:MAG: HAMP domain-containing histidine kinase [Saccharofermentans sp.]|jgi:signal transduction histidine kinase|nr:HAMP domain-containing histidine kinase [Mageeibacillus sp.]MCI1264351.1 HAMP domain-containing histidine kinase [Saccharofermentans sp.]MCI1275240.1 HAMP domain-containing histidine kinase [Saccharofermentans sp.]
MHLSDNPDVRRVLVTDAVITVVLTAAGYFLCGRRAALLLMSAGILFTAVYLVTTYRRYRCIADLSSMIDKVLHGDCHLEISDSKEGELAILQSEIYKMVLRLREQNEQLKDEKIYLADSLADVSHQLRTPLTSINLTVELLSKDEVTPQMRLKLTHDLKNSLKRIDWLVEVLLKLSRLDADMVEFRKDDVSVRALVDKACEPFYVLADVRGQSIIRDVKDESFTGDIGWSCEALGNLIKNSIEHTPAGGKILIRAVENDIYTEITVEDSGEGFTEGDIRHLFERFYRGKNSSPSSVGIGLALANIIILKQNGTIKAENADGGGARFVIKFYKKLV